MLAFFEMLMTMLADFRAGKLAPLAPSPARCAAGLERAAGTVGAAPALPEGWLGLWGWWRRKNASAQNDACEEYSAPRATASRGEGAGTGVHFEDGYTPTPTLPRVAGLGREADRRANGADGAHPAPSAPPAAPARSKAEEDAIAYARRPGGLYFDGTRMRWS
jgi:hypothetical protein